MKPSPLAPVLALAMALAAGACRNDPHAAPAGPGAASAKAAQEEAPRPASPAELAIVAPATPGAALEGYTIREIHGVRHGMIEVVCDKGPAAVILSIALFAEGGAAPPASTDRYAVFYSLRGAPAEDGERLATALARLLKTNGAVPLPPDLTPFVPRPLSL